MEFTDAQKGNILILTLSGRLDAAASEEFASRFLALIDGGARQIVMECAGLTYLSSMGLRSLLKATRELTSAGGRLTMHSLSEPLRQQLMVMGFSTMFRVYCDREEAIAALAITGLLPTLPSMV